MHKNSSIDYRRLRVVAFFFLLLAGWIIARLFILQVLQHNYYAAFALNAHEFNEKLHPERGEIFFQDSRTKQEYPAAVNKDFYLVYAAPKQIKSSDIVSTSERLAGILGFSEQQQRSALLSKLSKSGSGYQVISKKIPEEQMRQLKEANLPGIYFSEQKFHYYPEERLAANILGFTGFADNGDVVGKYGIEGYWEKELAGRGGFLEGERGALGSWITLAGRKMEPAQNGVDLVLTIDRTLEYKACERLREGLVEYKAKSAALILMDPSTGALLAMCSLPDFDPNNYSKVENIAAFNNTSIFTPYEPGSVFKALTMAAGLDLGLITPNTLFTDPCKLTFDGHTIHNAEGKCYKEQAMTQVLEKSINTGAVWVEQKVGREHFRDYIKKFGFGDKTGIMLNTEIGGDISSLNRKGQIFAANGSYGQGLTATPLQLAAAYGAIANEGKLLRPYVVDKVRYAEGKETKTATEVVEQVISPRSAKLLTGMLVSVIENHYRTARIDHYFVAGKTGTAQIAESGGYSATKTNHTFAGFAPADHPRFVLVVKYEEPERMWAEQTALPVYRDVMKFALDYYGVPAER